MRFPEARHRGIGQEGQAIFESARLLLGVDVGFLQVESVLLPKWGLVRGAGALDGGCGNFKRTGREVVAAPPCWNFTQST
jgi:hypothetical protein